MSFSHALIADLGGTNCRVRLMKLSDCGVQHETFFEQRYSSKDFQKLEEIMLHFLKSHDVLIGSEKYPQIAVLCVAGPVNTVTRTVINSITNTEEVIYGKFAHSTNLFWDMYSFDIASALSLPCSKVTLINDFEAIGYGVLGLDEKESFNLTPGKVPRIGSPIAVIGSGTGLGEAYLTSDNKGSDYTVHPSEGGHTTYAPTTQEEFNLLLYVQDEFGIHTSWERICSGTGIKSIYRFIKHRNDTKNELYLPINTHYYTTKPSIDIEPILGARHPAQVIFDLAKEGDDVCCQVVNLYLSALGREAGNMLGLLLAYGGVYLAGGMGAKIKWALSPQVQLIDAPNTKVDPTLFLTNVYAKGRLQPFIQDVPVHLVLIDEVGLLGCIVVAKRLITNKNE